MASEVHSEATEGKLSTFRSQVQKDIETARKATALQLNSRLEKLSDDLLEHTKRLDELTTRLEADGAALSEPLTVRLATFADRLDAFQVELSTSQDQVEASQTNVSNLREEIQKELAGLRMASEGQVAATETWLSTFRLDVQKDIETISDNTTSQLNDRLAMLNDQILEHTKTVDGLAPQLDADRARNRIRMATFAEQLDSFQGELATSRCQVEASQTDLSNLRLELKQKLDGSRKPSQGQSEATQVGMSAFKSEVQKDIQITSDAIALQLNARLDSLNDQILEHTKRLDGFTPALIADVLTTARMSKFVATPSRLAALESHMEAWPECS
jgi:predicted  nucleic acid-binding Zn-ribbon protein